MIFRNKIDYYIGIIYVFGINKLGQICKLTVCHLAQHKYVLT